MLQTSATEPGLAVRPTRLDEGLMLTGRGIADVSLGLTRTKSEPGQDAPITIGNSEPDVVVTRGSISSTATDRLLLCAIQEIEGGQLAPPNDIKSLLTQAVAAREARRGEDITAWSQRVADEAAHADS